MEPCERCGELHIDDYTTCLEGQIKKLRKRVDRLPKICGGSGFASLGMGCGGKFEEWEDAFLCVDCKTPYHQRCLLVTCASKYEKELKAGFEERGKTMERMASQATETERRVLEMEDKLEDISDLLDAMPSDHKNCTVENYEHARVKMRRIINDPL